MAAGSVIPTLTPKVLSFVPAVNVAQYLYSQTSQGVAMFQNTVDLTPATVNFPIRMLPAGFSLDLDDNDPPTQGQLFFCPTFWWPLGPLAYGYTCWCLAVAGFVPRVFREMRLWVDNDYPGYPVRGYVYGVNALPDFGNFPSPGPNGQGNFGYYGSDGTFNVIPSPASGGGPSGVQVAVPAFTDWYGQPNPTPVPVEPVTPEPPP